MRCLVPFALAACLLACGKKGPDGADPGTAERPATVPSAAPSAKGASAATTVTTTGPAPELLDDSSQEVEKAIALVRPSLRACYESALGEMPYLSVAVEVTLRVDSAGAGRITKVDGTMPPAMLSCVGRVLASLRLTPGHPTEVTFPLRYKSTRL